MSKGKSLILYIFLGLILLLGILMFALRLRFLDFISGGTFDSINEVLTKSVTPNAKEALDLKLLEDKRFTNLRNQVVNFDYDNFGQNTAANDIIVTDLETATASGTAATSSDLNDEAASSSKSTLVKSRVDIGNNNLFLKRLK